MHCCGNSFYRYTNNPFTGGCFCNANNMFGNIMMFSLFSRMMNNFMMPQTMPVYSMPVMPLLPSIFNYTQPYNLPTMPFSFDFPQPNYNKYNNFHIYNSNINFGDLTSKRTKTPDKNEQIEQLEKSDYKSAPGYKNMSNAQLKQIYGNYTKDATVLYKGTAEDLNNYLKGKGKLEGKGQAFIDAQNKYGISAAVLVAICINESGHGKSNLAINKNNVGGVRIAGSKEFRTFSSVEECIDYMGSFLKRGYLDKGLTQLYQINAKYCPVSDPTDKKGGNSHWACHVSKILSSIESQLA